MFSGTRVINTHNLNIQQMGLRCPFALPIGTVQLHGYELVFKGSKTGSYLTIQEREDSSVPAAVWRVTSVDEARLDRYEGYPRFYYKKPVEVNVLDRWQEKNRILTAFVYVMREYRPYGLPSPEYVEVCRKGYMDFDLDLGELGKALERTREEMRKNERG